MVVCQYFLKGDCRFGDKCRYEHPSAKKKTVCPHFLNGYCRFGDKCWNEHPGGSSSFGQQQSGFGQTGFRQSSSNRGGQWNKSYHNSQNRFEALSAGPRDVFGNQNSKATDSEQTESQIKKTIETDMKMWGMSKQWPLSCYTYTKEEPCLPGLLDFCPEEIRLEAYKANAEGKADTYQQGLKDLLNANQQRRLQLSQMPVSQIQEEIKKQTKSEAMDAGFQQTGSVFGVSASTGQSGLTSFGSTGFSAAPAGTSNQTGLFGSTNATNQSGLFGQSSVSGITGSVFGNTANSTNQATGMTGITSSFPATNQSGSLFGTMPGQSAASTGLFGTTSGQSAASTGLFGTTSGQSAASTGLFGTTSGQSAASTGLFGTKTEIKPGLFGPPSSTVSSGTFSSGPQQQKDGGNNSTSHVAPSSSMSSTSGTGTSSTNKQTTAATPVTLTCSEEDMQAFMADSFVLGKIPECPPPLELC